MPNKVKDLTGDQLRRIFRDYLIGRPKERLMKKYDISEETFWEIVGMYSKKKHPNDVGNAQDIEGPADLLVSPLDTGSTATENPIVARNPEDLQVVREQVVKEFDYDSPEEKLRIQGGEVNDLVRDRTAEEEKNRQDEAREIVADNKEATDAILEELTEASQVGKEVIAEEAIERAKATPSPEEVLIQRNEEQETLRRSEVAAEAARIKAAKEAQETAPDFKELVEQGKEENAESLKKQNEARQKEIDERAKEVTSAGEAKPTEAKAPTPAGDGGQSNVSGGSGQGAGGNPGAPSPAGNQGGGAVAPANTSPTAQPNPVEPAKVEPDGLKEK